MSTTATADGGRPAIDDSILPPDPPGSYPEEQAKALYMPQGALLQDGEIQLSHDGVGDLLADSQGAETFTRTFSEAFNTDSGQIIPLTSWLKREGIKQSQVSVLVRS
jgi:hypothetical protein